MFRISTLATATVLAVVLSLAGAPPALAATEDEDLLAGTSLKDGTSDGDDAPEGESGDAGSDDGGVGDDGEDQGADSDPGDDAANPDAGNTNGPADPGAPSARTLDLQLLDAADEPGTFADLVLNPATCTDGAVLTLDQDITGGRLTIGCTLTLHLAGHTLTTAGVLITPGKKLTINNAGEPGELVAVAADPTHAGIQTSGAELVINGGTVTATATATREASDFGAAGIGGGDERSGWGIITIAGGTVTATGNDYGAGIGGGRGSTGGSVTITGGSVRAEGGESGAGIGGGSDGDGGTTIIKNGTVTANGGDWSAGIGGGSGGHGGTVIIEGGIVSARGSAGAGIGGGKGGNGGPVTINGGIVTAISLSGAGIGGGDSGGVGNRSGGLVVIGEGAVVTATGENAVGQGRDGSYFGSLQLEGVLHVPSGSFTILDDVYTAGAGVVITATGKLLGAADDPTTGATITGDGRIHNGGVIALAASLVGVAVDGNNFEVDFDTQSGENPAPVRVFAPTFASGYRTLPTVPGGGTWNTAANGSGTLFAPTTALSPGLTLYAVTNSDAFAHSTENCTDGDALTLNEAVTTGQLTIGCDLTLHLAGHTLTTTGVLVTTNKTLTINSKGETGTLIATAANTTRAGIQNTGAKLVINGGTITATGGEHGAGIGGGDHGDGGTTTISGGTITATGGLYGAGIGGGRSANGGTVTITDGTITARGGSTSAGIGGGGANSNGIGGSGGTISISGGDVEAIGGVDGAGIGGGYKGSGGSITIADGSVTARGGANSAGIGGGDHGTGGTVIIGTNADVTVASGWNRVGAGANAATTDQFGSLTLNGTLRLPSGALRIPDSNPDGQEVVITATGKLLGTAADPTVGASITGPGQIANGGVIALTASLVNVTATGNNYAVGFAREDAATETVRVFGPRFDGSYRSVPAAGTHRGWNTSAEGTGAWFTATTALTDDLTVYETTRVGVTLTPEASTTDAGAPVTFTATVTDRETGEAVDDAPVTLASSVTSDAISGLQVTATEPGDRTITATVTGTTATGAATLTVRVPAPIGCNLGAPGIIVAPWSAQTVYQAGQLAALDGVVYKAAWYAHSDVPGASPWGPWEFHTVCGVSPDTVQAWSQTTVYDTGDQVTHNGKTWRAKWWTRNQAPGDPWGPWETVG